MKKIKFSKLNFTIFIAVSTMLITINTINVTLIQSNNFISIDTIDFGFFLNVEYSSISKSWLSYFFSTTFVECCVLFLLGL